MKAKRSYHEVVALSPRQVGPTLRFEPTKVDDMGKKLAKPQMTLKMTDGGQVLSSVLPSLKNLHIIYKELGCE
jgi:hypothetical protein